MIGRLTCLDQALKGRIGHWFGAILDLMDERDEMADGRGFNACFAPECADHANLRINLGLALAHGKVAVDARMGFGGMRG